MSNYSGNTMYSNNNNKPFDELDWIFTPRGAQTYCQSHQVSGGKQSPVIYSNGASYGGGSCRTEYKATSSLCTTYRTSSDSFNMGKVK